MKNSTSCFIITLILSSCLYGLTSCDSQTEVHKEVSITADNSRNTNALPGNSENPYDEVGWLHNELREIYYDTTIPENTIPGIVTRTETIANANSNFLALKDSNYHPLSSQRIQAIVEHKNTCVTDIINTSAMSSSGKLNLIGFVVSIVSLTATENNCNVLYNYIVDYEREIIGNSLLTFNDKKIILTTTSVARHSTYLKTKRPKKNTDPDWTVLIGNIIGATEGADYGLAEAVVTALATGLAQN